MLTEQEKTWQEEFGRDYTNRNFLSLEELELSSKRKFGITRTEANEEFLGDVNRCGWTLEVGCNIGNQLLCLQKMGFKNLYGIELQSYAVELSKSRTRGINIVQGSAFAIPFRSNFFDLVFTFGLLIHVAPLDISRVLDEIHRCTKDYIWGLEYYSDKYEEINYRGESNLLWKTNFAHLYLSQFNDLSLVKEKRYKHLGSENVTSMFLLKRSGEKCG